jgi:hypothetical protein
MTSLSLRLCAATVVVTCMASRAVWAQAPIEQPPSRVARQLSERPPEGPLAVAIRHAALPAPPRDASQPTATSGRSCGKAVALGAVVGAAAGFAAGYLWLALGSSNRDNAWPILPVAPGVGLVAGLVAGTLMCSR